MARALQTPATVVIIGDATAPMFCISDYMVTNEDMQEPTKLHEEVAPDFNQAVSAVTAHCLTEIKTAEGL